MRVIKLLCFASVLVLLTPLVLYPQSQSVHIGFVLDGPWERNEGILSLFQSEIQSLLERDYRLDFNPDDIVISDWKRKNIRAEIEKMLSDSKIDIVVTLGAVGSDIVTHMNNLSKPVIAPFIANVEIQGVPYDEGVSGVRNLTYIPIGYNFAGVLDIYRDVVPFERIAFIWPRLIIENIPALLIKHKHSFEGVDIEVIQLAVGETAEEALAAIPDDVDAVHVGVMIGMPEDELDKFIQGLIDRNIPGFAYMGRTDVERGLLAGLGEGIDIQRVARRTALNIQRILMGEEASRIPVTLNRRNLLYINVSTARQLDISPGWEVMTEAILLQETRETVAREMNLPKVTRQALDANLDLASMYHEVEAGEKEVALARANLLPRIDLSATGLMIDDDRAEASFGAQAERTISASASATQLIFSEQAWANLGIQGHLHKSRQAELRRLRLDIIQQASTAYLRLLTAKTLENIRQDNVSLTRSNLQLARTRQAIGLSGPGEVYRWESQLATSRQQAVDANAERNVAEIAVNSIINRPAEESFSTEETDIDDFIQEQISSLLSEYVGNKASFKIFRKFMVEEAFANSPELNALDEAIAAQKRRLKSTTNAFWAPQLALEGEITKKFSEEGAGTSGLTIPIQGFKMPQQDDLNWSIALNLSYPLFAGGQKFHKRAQASEELKTLQAQREALADKIEQRVRSTLHRAGASWAGIGFSRDAAKAAHQNLELVTDAYSRGVVSVIDLLDAQNAALVADLTAANAKYEFLIDIIDVQRASGKFYYLTGTDLEADFLQRLKAYYDEYAKLNQSGN